VHPESIVILLLLAATVVAILARRVRIPYTVALVLAGLVLGAVHAFDPPHLTQELLFSVFLPGLVFEAAFHLDFGALWRNRAAVAALAVPGVAISIALTAALLTAVVRALQPDTGFGWPHALVFAALIAATDPIAVVAIFKTLGAPKRLGLLMEGESLLNDGTAVVFFTLVLAYVSGGDVTAAKMVGDFVLIVGAGALVGGAVGLAASQVIRLIDDAMLEITVTTIAAYGSFAAAEQLHVSGVIATVVAGLLCGNYGARVGMSPSTRVAVEVFWEYVAFALNSLVFLLIGFEVHVGALSTSWLPILAAFVAVTAGRGVVVALVATLLRRTREAVPRRWVPVLAWGGLRGGLSMVLALSLPATFAYRELLVTMTFGVVALSILGQGLTMAPLLRRLGVVRPRAARAAYERARAELELAAESLVELTAMVEARRISPAAADEVRAGYQARVREAEAAVEALRVERHEVFDEEVRRTRRHLLLLERTQLRDALNSGLIGEDPYRTLAADLDARLIRLESNDEPEPRSAPA
jgi:CPA1 family monovalent cation:H+ antiporter